MFRIALLYSIQCFDTCWSGVKKACTTGAPRCLFGCPLQYPALPGSISRKIGHLKTDCRSRSNSSSSATIFTGRLLWQRVGIKFTRCVSGQKQHFCPCMKNYALDRKTIATFLMISTSSITMQNLGEMKQYAPGIGAKMWCFFLSHLVCLRARDRVWTSVMSRFIGWFWCCFHGFSGVITLSEALQSRDFSYSLLNGGTVFAKLRSKIEKTPKKSAKTFVRLTSYR